MEEKYASLGDRVKSILIDAFFLVLLMFAFSSILDNFDNPPVWLRVVMFLGIWLLYEPVCVAYGCTIGHYIMRIRVRKAKDNNKRIHIASSYVRYVIKLFLGWLSFLSIAFNDQKQAIHDLAVESVMIRV